MSYTDQRYFIDFCPNHGLSVLQCGWQKCDPGHHNSNMRYKHYSITFVLRGCGSYTVNGQTYSIHPGEGFVIFPGCIPTYQADIHDPWEYYFVVFQGSDAANMLRFSGIDPQAPTFLFPHDADMAAALHQLHMLSRSGAALGYDVIGQFLLCMSKLIRQQAQASQKRSSLTHYVEKAQSYMEVNYPYAISIRDVAAYIGIDRSHLYRIFRNTVGISPSAYLMNIRLEQSILLLQEKQLSVTEIAYSVGFYDVSHFTKAFKKAYHRTPKEYLLQTEAGPAAK